MRNNEELKSKSCVGCKSYGGFWKCRLEIEGHKCYFEDCYCRDKEGICRGRGNRGGLLRCSCYFNENDW